MTQTFVRACATTVRVWTYVYTCGLPPEVRDQRRAEIACDLWHGTRESGDGAGWLPGLHILLRLALGIPDDLGWRSEQRQHERSTIRAGLMAGGAAVLMLAGAWTLQPVSLLPVPPAPEVRVASAVMVPPPPPPPPPAASSSSSVQDGLPPFPAAYGRASYVIDSQGPAPARIKDVAAVYPPILHAAAVEGVVIVEGRITASGRVTDVRAAQPRGLLTQPAINAVTQWEFESSDTDGDQAMLTVTVRFTGDGTNPRLPWRARAVPTGSSGGRERPLVAGHLSDTSR